MANFRAWVWRLAVLGGAACTATPGCGNGGSDTFVGGGSGGELHCTTGDEGCSCYPNDTCNDELVCRSGTCHTEQAAGGSGGRAAGGSTGQGGSSSDSGAAGVGEGGGGASGANGGSSAGTGLAGSAGSAAGEANAGTANAGTANGGTANGGTANGGTANAGTANGGTANGGTANGGTANGGTANGGTANGGTANGGTGGTASGSGGSSGQGGSSGGDGRCSNPIVLDPQGTYHLGTTAAVCAFVPHVLQGYGCQYGDGRTLKINGVIAPCVGQVESGLPAPVDGGYYFDFSAGLSDLTFFYWWYE